MVSNSRRQGSSMTYSFTIHNNSGGRQSYTLYAGVPDIKPVQDQITSHAIVVAKGVASGSGAAAFVVPRNDPYAICGTFQLDQSIRIQVLDKQQVRLGSKVSGFDQPGTSCLMNVDAGAIFFDPWSGPAHDAGEPGAFCVKSIGFTEEEAKRNGYVLGLGIASSTTADVGLHASFVPKPNTVYQIKPSHIFYIVATEADINQPKPGIDEAGPEAAVDFSIHPNHVQLIHGDDNKLRISEDMERSASNL